MSELTFYRTPAAVPLDRETLLARFDGIRQFARGGRRAPNKPLLLLYALARLSTTGQAEIRFNTAEAALQPHLRVYGPWGASARVSYPYSRLLGDGLWQLPDRAELFGARGLPCRVPGLTLLMPVVARRQLNNLRDELWTRVNVEFYKDDSAAVFKALVEYSVWRRSSVISACASTLGRSTTAIRRRSPLRTINRTST